MLKWLYKVYLAIYDNKFLSMCRLFVLSYDVRHKKYIIWYLDDCGRLKYYDSCSSGEIAKFKWDILMSRGAT